MPTWGFFIPRTHVPKAKKQQVPLFSCRLGAFSFHGRPLQERKSNKYPRFHADLGLFHSPDVCSKSENATSTPVFMPTWGFFIPRTPAPRAKKQQVPPFSCRLGAFSFLRRLLQKRKCNKYPCFHADLGLFHSSDVCFRSENATSTPVFMPTWGFFIPQTSASKAKMQQVPLFSCRLGAFSFPGRPLQIRMKNSYCQRIFTYFFIFIVRPILCFFTSTSRTWTSTMSPTLTASRGCLM